MSGVSYQFVAGILSADVVTKGVVNIQRNKISLAPTHSHLAVLKGRVPNFR